MSRSRVVELTQVCLLIKELGPKGSNLYSFQIFVDKVTDKSDLRKSAIDDIDHQKFFLLNRLFYFKPTLFVTFLPLNYLLACYIKEKDFLYLVEFSIKPAKR